MCRFLNWKSKKRSNGSTIPSSREGHSLTFIEPLKMLVMFGGCSNQKNSDLFVYSLDSETWQRKQAKGTGPSPRCYHCAAYNRKQPILIVERLNALMIVGGYTSQNISVNDVYFLLLESWSWKVFRSLQSFPKRHHFSMVQTNIDELIVFGGLSRPTEGVLNDCWRVALRECKFSEEHEPRNVIVSEFKAQGRSPTARYGHQCFLLREVMYVFGGHLELEEFDHSIYLLDIQNKIWSSFLPSFNTEISSRASSMVMQLSSTEILVFGGTSTASTENRLEQTAILDLSSCGWSVPFLAGERPETRCYCSSAQPTDSTMLIIGGLFDKYCSMQFLELEVAVNTESIWEPIKQPSKLQLKALTVLSSTVVRNNQDILTLEWAIRQEVKTAKLLQTIESGRQVKKQKEVMEKQRKQELRKLEQLEREKKQQEFEQQEYLFSEIKKLEQQQAQNLQRAIAVQERYLVHQLAHIQGLQRSAQDTDCPEQIDQTLTHLKQQLGLLLAHCSS